MPNHITIKTPRIMIRDFAPDDLDSIINVQDNGFHLYIANHDYRYGDSRTRPISHFLDKRLEEQACPDRTSYTFGIWQRETGNFLGITSLNYADSLTITGTYIVAPERGKAYGRESRMTMNYLALTHLEREIVRCHIAHSNHVSIKNIETMGGYKRIDSYHREFPRVYEIDRAEALSRLPDLCKRHADKYWGDLCDLRFLENPTLDSIQHIITIQESAPERPRHAPSHPNLMQHRA